LSALTPLSAFNLWRSHLVNCSKCIALKPKKRMCPVGLLLWAKAKAEPEKAYKPKSFPFVAKLYERIKGEFGTEWKECVVVDRSVAAAGRIIPGTEYRAKTSGIIGYEVALDDDSRHYLNARQIKPLKPKVRKTPFPPLPKVVGPMATDPRGAIPKLSSILVILRRSK
jgi:hypothetical protein